MLFHEQIQKKREIFIHKYCSYLKTLFSFQMNSSKKQKKSEKNNIMNKIMLFKFQLFYLFIYAEKVKPWILLKCKFLFLPSIRLYFLTFDCEMKPVYKNKCRTTLCFLHIIKVSHLSVKSKSTLISLWSFSILDRWIVEIECN